MDTSNTKLKVPDTGNEVFTDISENDPINASQAENSTKDANNQEIPPQNATSYLSPKRLLLIIPIAAAVTVAIYALTLSGSTNDAATLKKPQRTLQRKVNLKIGTQSRTNDITFRIPEYFHPFHYNIEIKALSRETSFTGKSQTYFTVSKSTSLITIHSLNLNYTYIRIFDQNNVQVQIFRHYTDNKMQFLIIYLKEILNTNEIYILEAIYNGFISDVWQHGFYVSDSISSFGESFTFYGTHMYPSHARKVFPCFDEPGFTSTFNLSLIHEPKFFVLSNTPKISTNVYGNGLTRTLFEITPRMSVYLLGFVMCDYTFMESKAQNNIRIRIYGDSKTVESGSFEYVKQLTPKVFDFFQNMLFQPPKMQKVDLVSLPFYNFGSTEHWGLLIFWEYFLKYSPTDEIVHKEDIVTRMSHELARMWFENLVTCRWWNEYWLIEGIATYFEYFTVDKVESGFKMEEQFVLKAMKNSMDRDQRYERDAVISLNPIASHRSVLNFNTPAMHDKGACIIHMLYAVLGQIIFEQGLKTYLSENAYRTVTSKILLDTFEKTAKTINPSVLPSNGLDFAIRPWLTQIGYPLITMIRRQGSNIIDVTQELFISNPSKYGPTTNNIFRQRWDVPIWYKIDGDSNIYMKWYPRRKRTDQINVPEGRYFIGNYQSIGYYRVNYDSENWILIVEQLYQNHAVIGVKSRVRLLLDATQLCRSNQLSCGITIYLASYLYQENEYSPWKAAEDLFKTLEKNLRGSAYYSTFSKYMILLTSRLYEQFSSINSFNVHTQEYLKVFITKLASKYGYQGWIDLVRNRFTEWMQETGSVDQLFSPALRKESLCTAVRHGGDAEWNFLLQKYNEEQSYRIKTDMCIALTCTESEKIAKNLLQMWLINQTFVPSIGEKNFVNNLCRNDAIRNVVWDFLTVEQNENYKLILNHCGVSINDKIGLQKVEQYVLTSGENLAFKSDVQLLIKNVQAKFAWRKQKGETVNEKMIFALRQHQILV